MCLSKIDQVPYGDSDIGYKVLHYRKPCNRGRKCLSFPYQQVTKVLRIGMTLTDSETYTLLAYPITEKKQRYLTGYHIFTTLEAARTYSTYQLQDSVIVLVRYCNKVASGYNTAYDRWGRQIDLPTVVARQMTLLKIVEERG